MGIFPGVGSITIQGMHDGHMMAIPLFRSMNADVNMTLAIAIISVVMTQVFGVAALGMGPHIGKYFVAPWKDPIMSFVGILELVAEFAKMISFTFRLFGNIFAGEVLLVVISFLVPYIAPLPFLGLEIFVGFIQALVFSLLTAVFLKMATMAHGEHAH
jgi:F-type H+-transporting ATPase subunit a